MGDALKKFAVLCECVFVFLRIGLIMVTSNLNKSAKNATFSYCIRIIIYCICASVYTPVYTLIIITIKTQWLLFRLRFRRMLLFARNDGSCKISAFFESTSGLIVQRFIESRIIILHKLIADFVYSFMFRFHFFVHEINSQNRWIRFI